MFPVNKLPHLFITPLVHLINSNFQNTMFPNKQKVGTIFPVYKTGNPHILDNFKPVVLASEVFEYTV